MNVEDCRFIQKVVKDHCNANISLRECYELWSGYSESYSAGWLCVDDNPEDIAEIINVYNRMYSK